MEAEVEEWELVINTNAHGTFLRAREALKVVVENGDGAIVNVASISSVIGVADQV